MDVFYYWKDFKEDRKKKQIGWLKSEKNKLNSFKSRHPDFIWAFKTPQGQKGKLQLLARLKWSDVPIVKPAVGTHSMIFYIPNDVESVRYIDTSSMEAIEAVTDILHKALPPSAFLANFQGENGQHILEYNVTRELSKFAANCKVSAFSVDD
jgi:hypothetical protein